MAELKIEQLGFLNRGPYDFKVTPGTILCLSGASGAGKSLILRSIADLDVHNGRIWLDNISSEDLSGPEWRRKVMFLPAESQWWHETVAEHLSEKPQQELLENLSFDNQILTWEISRLSTGEKQRLALLRALLLEPEVLLLDEPTASLDKAGVENVETIICDYVKNRSAAAIWVSHDHDQITRVADLHYEIEQGGKMRQIK